MTSLLHNSNLFVFCSQGVTTQAAVNPETLIALDDSVVAEISGAAFRSILQASQRPELVEFKVRQSWLGALRQGKPTPSGVASPDHENGISWGSERKTAALVSAEADFGGGTQHILDLMRTVPLLQMVPHWPLQRICATLEEVCQILC